jgi:hypothetical protein
MAVTTPEVTPMVATDGSLLVQETPTGELVSTETPPTQSDVVPDIAPTAAFTVTTAVL